MSEILKTIIVCIYIYIERDVLVILPEENLYFSLLVNQLATIMCKHPTLILSNSFNDLAPRVCVKFFFKSYQHPPSASDNLLLSWISQSDQMMQLLSAQICTFVT